MTEKVIISKQELRQELGNISRPTLLNWVKILCVQHDCPINYEKFKRGHFVSKKVYNYIIENL